MNGVMFYIIWGGWGQGGNVLRGYIAFAQNTESEDSVSVAAVNKAILKAHLDIPLVTSPSAQILHACKRLVQYSVECDLGLHVYLQRAMELTRQQHKHKNATLLHHLGSQVIFEQIQRTAKLFTSPDKTASVLPEVLRSLRHLRTLLHGVQDVEREVAIVFASRGIIHPVALDVSVVLKRFAMQYKGFCGTGAYTVPNVGLEGLETEEVWQWWLGIVRTLDAYLGDDTCLKRSTRSMVPDLRSY